MPFFGGGQVGHLFTHSLIAILCAYTITVPETAPKLETMGDMVFIPIVHLLKMIPAVPSEHGRSSTSST